MKRLLIICLGFLLLSTKLQAQISNHAIYEFLQKETTQQVNYSFLLGKVALDSGFAYNIRFFGPYTEGQNHEGKRDYSKDHSADPLWNIVKTLFPSANGDFNLGENYDNNLSKALKKVEQNKGKAQVIAFTKQLFEFVNKIKNNPENDINMRNEASVLFSGGEFKNFRRNNKHQVLVENIYNSILKEQQNTAWYPKGTTDQMLHAFFMMLFDFGDLENYINTVSEIATVSDTADLKELYSLILEESLNKPSVYPDKASVISNGKAYAFDRANNQQLELSFADCVETTIRVIMNFTFYDPKQKAFSLQGVKINDEYRQSLESFYQKQPIEKYNDGSTTIRSEFNHIVGDINRSAQARESVYPIKYAQETSNNVSYELETGFVNLLYVFYNIFGFQLDPYPNQTLNQTNEWLETSFQALLQHLNPNYNYKIELKNIKQTDSKGDLTGEITIIALAPSNSEDKSEQNNEVFRFNIDVSANHTYIKNVQVNNQAKLDKDKAIAIIDNMSTYHSSALESMHLLSQELIGDIKQPLYHIFHHTLMDDDSYITSIQKINDCPLENEQVIEQILDKLLLSLNWDDAYVLQQVSPIIVSLLDNNRYINILSKRVLGFYCDRGIINFDDTKINQTILEQLLALKRLYIDNIQELDTLAFRKENNSLKSIKLSNSKISEVQGLNKLSALETFEANLATLDSLNFGGQNIALREVNIEKSSVKEITGLDKLSALEKFFVDNVRVLNSLTFGEQNKMLKEIVVEKTDVSSITGLDKLSALENCYADNNCKLREVTFGKQNSVVKEIDVSYSSQYAKMYKIHSPVTVNGVENLENVKIYT